MDILVGKRILVVEDEFIVAAMATDMLVDLGAKVVGPAGTLAKALFLAQNEHFDAAVLDVNMHGVRIDPVAKVLNERGVPIVFATGYGESALQGVVEAPVLDKPYTQESLGEALARALGAAR
jgi:CheY-like chemotaxis protein